MKKCLICQGHLKKQKTDIARYWGRELVALNNVPVLVCQRCGERYFEAKVSANIDEKIKSVLEKKHTSVKINIPVVQF